MAKRNWLRHEEECCEYLERKYSSERVVFCMQGGSDSGKSDIAVCIGEDFAFYVEAKMPTSQCGQFVLFPDEINARFLYSPHNRSPRGAAADAIISEMNRNFDKFKIPSTKELGLDRALYVNWIIEHYSSSGVKYFMTKSDDVVIFPIEKFGDYFDVTAVYRVKKSGSSNPGLRYVAMVERLLEERGVRYENLRFEGKKLFVDIFGEASEFKISCDGVEFFFRKGQGDGYAVTKLSKTNNANVIFSISLKRGVDDKDIRLFESELL